MRLKRAGLFSELAHGDRGGPSLREARGLLPPELKAPAAGYLAGGAVLATSGVLVRDWFTEAPGIAIQELQTDGEWVWSRDLAHYVQVHAVDLPQEFLARMKGQGWQCPEISEEQLIALADAYLASA